MTATATGYVKRHESCGHSRYRLTCQQLDQLREAAAGRCQICEQLARYVPGWGLQIDHDKALGFWAVRGLLCSRCNQALDSGRLTGPEVDAYLANPWYLCLPFADQAAPEVRHLGRPVDLATAPEMLANLAATAEDARRRQLSGWRDVRESLLDLVRDAYRSGMIQTKLCAATGLTREQVYRAVKERRDQPVFTDDHMGYPGR